MFIFQTSDNYSIKFALSLHYFDESDKSNMISYYCAIYVTLSYLWKILFLIGGLLVENFILPSRHAHLSLLDMHTYQNLVNAPIDVHISYLSLSLSLSLSQKTVA